jgi:hypothetical protein
MEEKVNQTKRERRLAMMKALWKAQGKHCAVCGVYMVPVHYLHPKRGWSIEHVWPQARYAYEHQGNRLISHIECNNEKSDRDPTGCEVITLLAANAILGFELIERPQVTSSEPVHGPTALSLAFQRAMGMKSGPLFGLDKSS